MKESYLLPLWFYPLYLSLSFSISTEPLIIPLPFFNPQKSKWKNSDSLQKRNAFRKPFFNFFQEWGIRVFIGFNFKPMLSGERSSGAMQDGLKGLLGLTLDWEGLYKPYPMRKYSSGINIACGCSSVTIDPHAWTCRSPTRPVMSLHYIHGKVRLKLDMTVEISRVAYLNQGTISSI